MSSRSGRRPPSARAKGDEPASMQQPPDNDCSSDDSEAEPALWVVDAGEVQAQASPMKPFPTQTKSAVDPTYEPNHAMPLAKQKASRTPASLPEAPPPTGLPALPPPPPVAQLQQGSTSDSATVTEPLYGWLYKKHSKAKTFGSNWAKRYFSISERYGTLNYSKSEGKSANIMLPLCDIKTVERLEIEEHGPYCFSVICPPASLTLRARDNNECQKWIQAIVHHAALWKAKAASR